ncbi:metal/formaldehyde-sensitive transcriptional repressor [Solimonas terrae]|uniref:Metal/formaldehyde-sensitive transcriptional repressor n=1 Tax=Solimonas terrae TaxID=1396819 RepID=A0A6M2BPR0_9GAMM|nr:metal/formaldehyde-sensitive transcriptional repressor [Solimonas terrae]NGY04057.1 metal/formaldehyde-sensitive transcriptional repressor [Solimonas terrae]
MSHTIENKKPLLNRVRRMRGQLGSLEKALETGTECGAVLQQIAAIRGAVNGLMNEVLEGHLRTHLVPMEGAAADEIEDLIKVIRSYLK